MKTVPNNSEARTSVKHCNINDFFTERKKNLQDGSNLPWLITFSDLMTILLVFSIALYSISGNSSRHQPSPSKSSKTNSSFVPLAHANIMQKVNELSIPVNIKDETLPQILKPEEEKIILTKYINFDRKSTSLKPVFHPDLDEFGLLALKNPTAKIIVTANLDDDSSLPLQQAMGIVDHLVKKYSFNKKRVYLQTQTAQRPAIDEPQSSQNEIEVKLIKDFWGF